MDFFELKAAMKAKAPVMTKIVQPSFTTVVVGRVVGVGYRLDENEEEIGQAEIRERGKNSIVTVPIDSVERLWEVATKNGRCT